MRHRIILTTFTDDPRELATAAAEARRWADAGATWRLEADWSAPSLAVRRRIGAGPPA